MRAIASVSIITIALILAVAISSVHTAPKNLFYSAARHDQKITFLAKLKQPRKDWGSHQAGGNSNLTNLIRGSLVAVEDTLQSLANTYYSLERLLEGTDRFEEVANIIERATLESEAIVLEAVQGIQDYRKIPFGELQRIVLATKNQIESVAFGALPEIEKRVESLDLDTAITVHEFLQYFITEARYSERYLHFDVIL